MENNVKKRGFVSAIQGLMGLVLMGAILVAGFMVVLVGVGESQHVMESVPTATSQPFNPLDAIIKPAQPESEASVIENVEEHYNPTPSSTTPSEATSTVPEGMNMSNDMSNDMSEEDFKKIEPLYNAATETYNTTSNLEELNRKMMKGEPNDVTNAEGELVKWGLTESSNLVEQSGLADKSLIEMVDFLIPALLAALIISSVVGGIFDTRKNNRDSRDDRTRRR